VPFCDLGISLKMLSQYKMGSCILSHPQKAISTFSLLWNLQPSRCCFSVPIGWMFTSLQWNDYWKYVCLMCAICGCIAMLNVHTSQRIICWGYWSNIGEAALSTWMRKCEWLFVHKGLQMQEVHLYCDRTLKIVPRWYKYIEVARVYRVKW
jgi:hypothetical protein